MSKIMYNDRAYGEIIGGGAGGLGGGIELTQAEYDALDQEEKDKDIIYFITDGNPELTIVNDSVPVGAIQAYAGTTPPSNWLICDGRTVNRTKYAKLFAVIGTTYGEGNGETTFNLPNLQGRVAIGRSEDYELGANGGEETHLLTAAQSGIQEHLHTYSKSATTTGSHTLTTSEIPSHQHKIALVNQGSLDHGINFTYGTTAKGGMYGGSYTESVGGGSGHTHGITLTSANTGASSSDASEAHNNMQPYLVTNYIIKAIESSIVEKEKFNFLDLFYPIGSYYETSVTDFDPNVSWGGTWVLETEGFVHVSSGSIYTIGLTGGDKLKTYTPEGSVQSHTLTESEIPSHVGHLPVNSGSHTGYGNAPGKYLPLSSMSTYGSQGRGWDDNGSEYTMYGVSRGGSKGHTHGFSGTKASIDVMQPYIVVNRWHRTA